MAGLSGELSSSEGDPEDRCAICLCNISNRAFLDKCWHRFCFVCIMQWSEVTPSCPLCKQPFDALIYDVESETQFKRLVVESDEAAAARVRARRAASAGNYRASVGGARLLRWTAAHETREEIYRNGTRALSSALGLAALQVDGVVGCDAATAGSAPVLDPQSLALLRARLSSKRYNGSAMYRRRLQRFIRRDVFAMLGRETAAPQVEVVVQVVLDACRQVSLCSRECVALIEAFVGGEAAARHFLHELCAFALSPYSLEAYSRVVRYPDDNNVDEGGARLFPDGEAPSTAAYYSALANESATTTTTTTTTNGTQSAVRESGAHAHARAGSSGAGEDYWSDCSVRLRPSERGEVLSVRSSSSERERMTVVSTLHATRDANSSRAGHRKRTRRRRGRRSSADSGGSDGRNRSRHHRRRRRSRSRSRTPRQHSKRRDRRRKRKKSKRRGGRRYSGEEERGDDGPRGQRSGRRARGTTSRDEERLRAELAALVRVA